MSEFKDSGERKGVIRIVVRIMGLDRDEEDQGIDFDLVQTRSVFSRGRGIRRLRSLIRSSASINKFE